MTDPLAIARALLAFDAMALRLLAAEALEDPADLSCVPEPAEATAEELAAAAAVVELLCERAGVPSPEWTERAPSLPQPRFVLSHAARMPRLRALCERESPPALRRHGFLAPPDFLTTA